MAKAATLPELEPAIFVIFGITGDLSQKKLLPALYHLIKIGLLHEDTEIIGVSRRRVTTSEVIDATKLCINEQDGVCDPVSLHKLQQMVHMEQVDLTDGPSYDKLKTILDGIEDKHGVCMNRLFYLSIPPQVYGPIVNLLGQHGLNKGCQHRNMSSRLLIEKPFGYDLQSAEELIAETGRYFKEVDIFRIDHYVAKETVQNILAFRSNNTIFDSLWDRKHIHHLEIMATQKIDIEGRAIFYEEMGALRDLIQSHLLQLLAIVTMEIPKTMSVSSIHEAKLDLMKHIKPVPADEVWRQTVRGQYDGYRKEVSNPRSQRETFAALKLFIHRPRWDKVPILIKTGKALDAQETKVVVTFRNDHGEPSNSLTFSIQPDEGISLNLIAKQPGFDYQLQPVNMSFSYKQSFHTDGHPDAYERVLVDAVRGDHTLFSTSEEVLASWRVLENVIRAWDSSSQKLHSYKKGSHGPEAADELASSLGVSW